MKKIDALEIAIRSNYSKKDGPVALHKTSFQGKELDFLKSVLESGVVSTNGDYVIELEKRFSKKVNSRFAVAVNSGTSALHTCLSVLGVDEDCEVLTQSLSFIATANAVTYCRAVPIFLDVEKESLGLDPEAFLSFLSNNCYSKDGLTYNKTSGKRIGAVIPVHVFGRPCHIEQICEIASRYNIPVVEDSAESIGSLRHGKQTGTFGSMGIFSFNGNKTITSGGGGIIVTDSEEFYLKALSFSKICKIPTKWSYDFSGIGYNYRMPNLNAALALAQLERLDELIERKKEIALSYLDFGNNYKIHVLGEQMNCETNFWLNAILLESKKERDYFLDELNSKGIDSQPIWPLIHQTKMYDSCETDGLENTKRLFDRLVTLPS